MIRGTRGILAAFLGAIVSIALTGCDRAPSERIDPTATSTIPDTAQALAASGGEYRLGTGDKVRVVVFNEPALSGEFQVDDSGAMSMPLAGQQKAAGLTPRELEKQLTTIAGVEAMTSTSSLGSTSITLQFALDRNIDAAAQDVRAIRVDASGTVQDPGGVLVTTRCGSVNLLGSGSVLVAAGGSGLISYASGCRNEQDRVYLRALSF